MNQAYAASNYDENGNPAGGFVEAAGLRIDWQNGPLGRGENRLEPNGAFVETVIAAAIQRLDARTAAREARGVEGTHDS